MHRRDVIGLFGVTAMWPLAALAQPLAKTPTIGFLGASSRDIAAPWVSAFVKRLNELGWIEGRTVIIEYRWAEARADLYNEIAAEFSNRKVDVIVTWASAPTLAAKRATSTIPVVFAAQMDPVGAGIVASLAQPGGNVTGMSIQQTDTVGKRIELLREVIPKLARLGVLANASAPGAMIESREVSETARRLGLEVTRIEIKQAEEIIAALKSFKSQADALYVATDPLIFTDRVRINAIAQSERLPTIYGGREYVEAGGLMSYGPNWTDLFKRAAEQVNKILRGTKPTEIPVEQPTRFDLVINQKTAKALGLDLPAALLARADEVIE